MSIQNSAVIRSGERVTRSEIYKVCEAGYNEVASAILRHAAFKELERFGEVISARPLTHQDMALFFWNDLGFF